MRETGERKNQTTDERVTNVSQFHTPHNFLDNGFLLKQKSEGTRIFNFKLQILSKTQGSF